jgi:hypothetical protein
MTESMTVTVAQFNVAIPRKRVQSQKHHDAAMDKYTLQFKSLMRRFFDGIHEAIQRTIRFDVVKCFIIAGPGFVKVLVLMCWWLTILRTNSTSI